jgi:hypothetical protein
MSELTRREVVKLAAAAAGVAVAGVAVGQPPKVPLAPPPVAEPARVADPLAALLADGKAAMAKVRDYTCTFTRQERIGGVLGAEQVAEMKVRTQPAAATVRFAKPEVAFGLEMTYAANKRDGKIRYRPGGIKATVVLVSDDDAKLLAANRHPVTKLGVGATLDLVASVAAREKALGNGIEVFTSDFKFDGAAVTRYEIYTRRPHAHRYAHKMVVFVNNETKLPVRFEAYDQPKSGSGTGELLESYSYSNVKYNVGIADAAFD